MKKTQNIKKIFILIVVLSLISSFIILTGCPQPKEQVSESAEAESTENEEAAGAETTETETTEAEIATETDSETEEVEEVTPDVTPVPMGPRIVFVSNRGDDQDVFDLYILDMETEEIIPLNTGIGDVVLPKWSPDGNQILFGVRHVWNLYIINIDGTGLTQLTDFRSNNGDWSPDGTQIIFQSDHQNEPQDTPDIYRIDVDGKNLVEILDDPPVADFNPRWSPDGSHIMFISDRSGNYEVFVMNADGSDVKQITDSEFPIIDFSLSPDDTLIVYTYAYAYPDAADLYTIDKDESVVQITDNKGEAFDESPSWSMDNKKIFFSSNRSGNKDLWVIDIDSSDLVQLTDDQYDDSSLDYWAP
jgi:TolB protein